jgi:dihydropteroate synthase
MQLRCRDRVLDLSRVAVMGVLNVTPDSFSDGGLWLEPATAVSHGLEMVAQGAAIVDVGGESTRPGATPVPEEEELRRVLPVIQGLVRATDAVISIDTRKPTVALRAVEAGATIINDTAGEASDREMDKIAGATGAAIVIMHSRGTPATMRDLNEYDDVVTDVCEFLETRANELRDLGIPDDGICLDPGIGFAKSPAQNLEILRRLDEVTDLPWPILIGTSRKSFIGAVLDVPEDQRLEGGLATDVISAIAGVRIVRVHDVEPTVRALKMTEAVIHLDR